MSRSTAQHGLIRKWDVTDAAKFEGAMLRDGLLDKTNTASSVWAELGLSLEGQRDVPGQ